MLQQKLTVQNVELFQKKLTEMRFILVRTQLVPVFTTFVARRLPYLLNFAFTQFYSCQIEIYVPITREQQMVLTF